MPLTEQQDLALQALSWLHSEKNEDRGSGRSTVVALALIRRSIETHKAVEVDDHEDSMDADQQLIINMSRIVLEYGGRFEVRNRYRFQVVHSTRSLEEFVGMHRTKKVLPPSIEEEAPFSFEGQL